VPEVHWGVQLQVSTARIHLLGLGQIWLLQSKVKDSSACSVSLCVICDTKCASCLGAGILYGR